MSEERPPVKRLRLVLWLHGDDPKSIARELANIAWDIENENREWRQATGGGYHYEIDVTDPDMTPERYAEELNAWVDARKLSRRSDTQRTDTEQETV